MNIGKHGNHARGERLPQSKLTAETVRQMRQDYAEAQQRIHDLKRKASIKALAAEYGVDRKTIRLALSGETWAHVR